MNKLLGFFGLPGGPTSGSEDVGLERIAVPGFRSELPPELADALDGAITLETPDIDWSDVAVMREDRGRDGVGVVLVGEGATVDLASEILRRIDRIDIVHLVPSEQESITVTEGSVVGIVISNDLDLVALSSLVERASGLHDYPMLPLDSSLTVKPPDWPEIDLGKLSCEPRIPGGGYNEFLQETSARQRRRGSRKKR